MRVWDELAIRELHSSTTQHRHRPPPLHSRNTPTKAISKEIHGGQAFVTIFFFPVDCSRIAFIVSFALYLVGVFPPRPVSSSSIVLRCSFQCAMRRPSFKEDMNGRGEPRFCPKKVNHKITFATPARFSLLFAFQRLFISGYRTCGSPRCRTDSESRRRRGPPCALVPAGVGTSPRRRSSTCARGQG
jgi:hypothetical protein